MECPYCRDSFHPQWNKVKLGDRNDISYELIVLQQDCPSCGQLIVKLLEIERTVTGTGQTVTYGGIEESERDFWVVPPYEPVRELPSEVPDKLKREFEKAERVLPISPEASAALSRRNLQYFLREHAGVEPSRSLAEEIEKAMKQDQMPAHLRDTIDAVRNVGNFAAHPIKDKEAGEIVDVEEGEAEWLLDILEQLYQVYIVTPAKMEKRKDDLNEKLDSAGKPEMKTDEPDAEET